MVSALFVCALALWGSGTALAQSGVCSDTSLSPGQSISVSGSGAGPGETATLMFNGSVIGAGTVDGFGNFTVSGNVPGSTTPGTYSISVTFTASPTIVPCSVTVQQAAPTPTPTDDPDDDADDDDADDESDVEAVPAQQQQLIVPAVHAVPVYAPAPAARKSLPTTGLDLVPLAEGGSGSLLVGLSLLGLTRRRRRSMRSPDADVPPAVAPPSHTYEGDLLPYWPAD